MMLCVGNVYCRNDGSAAGVQRESRVRARRTVVLQHDVGGDGFWSSAFLDEIVAGRKFDGNLGND